MGRHTVCEHNDASSRPNPSAQRISSLLVHLDPGDRDDNDIRKNERNTG